VGRMGLLLDGIAGGAGGFFSLVSFWRGVGLMMLRRVWIVWWCFDTLSLMHSVD
jgi:hypothetical protein